MHTMVYRPIAAPRCVFTRVRYMPRSIPATIPNSIVLQPYPQALLHGGFVTWHEPQYILNPFVIEQCIMRCVVEKPVYSFLTSSHCDGGRVVAQYTDM